MSIKSAFTGRRGGRPVKRYTEAGLKTGAPDEREKPILGMRVHRDKIEIGVDSLTEALNRLADRTGLTAAIEGGWDPVGAAPALQGWRWPLPVRRRRRGRRLLRGTPSSCWTNCSARPARA